MMRSLSQEHATELVNHRTETDTLGHVTIPVGAAYGSQTARALLNFPITGNELNYYPEIVRSLAVVKKACALANNELGTLEQTKSDAIVEVCDEIIEGRHHEHFVVDVIQGGAGTSTNMNANEVIANLGLHKLGLDFGDYCQLHPIDHVNLSQSTNDVYPTAIRLSILFACDDFVAAQQKLYLAFGEKASEFERIMKVGRTQLQDAVPMSLGSEFASFAATIKEDIERIGQLSELLKEVNLGGTAIGTGINAPDGYAKLAISHLTSLSGFSMISSVDLIEASSDVGALVTFSGVLKRIAVKLSKICNDLRLLSSGPRAGIGEIILPPVQAGSSIMPGKVNPVIPEVVNQVCYQVIGNELTVTMAAEAGQLQLNAMEPVIVANILESLHIMSRAMNVLSDRCVVGIQADLDRCAFLLHDSLVLATALTPFLGYEKAAEIAKHAQRERLSITGAAAQISDLTQSDVEIAIKRSLTFDTPLAN